MKTISTLLIALGSLILCQAEEPPPNFVSLFNGRDLEGWLGDQSWSVEDQALTGRTEGDLKANSFIVWQGEPLRNFDLRLLVRVSEGGNSGIQYRSQMRPDLGPYRLSGYQCDVVERVPKYNGMLYEEKGRRILAPHGTSVVIDPDGQPWITESQPVTRFAADQWHEYRILAEGNRLRHWINGQLITDVIDLDETGRSLEGLLAVQVHVGPPMKIQYKDIFLKRLADDLPLLDQNDAPIPPEVLQVRPQAKLPADWQPLQYKDRALLKN